MLLDMTDLDYISSAGLRVLLIVAKRLNPLGGRLLCGLRPAVTPVFEIAGFATLVPIAATRDEAVAKLA